MGTTMSKNMAQATLRAKSLYRNTMRSVQAVVTGYELECTPEKLKSVVRMKFREQLHVKEAAVVDVLCYKGEQELQETMQMWKTKAHVQKYVDYEDLSRPDFARDFFEGNQAEDWTWPPIKEQLPQLKN